MSLYPSLSLFFPFWSLYIMETGTCCWPAPPHICCYNTPGSHNRPGETESFDLQNLRGALHAELKIKCWFSKSGWVCRLIVSTLILWFLVWDKGCSDEVMTNTLMSCLLILDWEKLCESAALIIKCFKSAKERLFHHSISLTRTESEESIKSEF